MRSKSKVMTINEEDMSLRSKNKVMIIYARVFTGRKISG